MSPGIISYLLTIKTREKGERGKRMLIVMMSIKHYNQKHYKVHIF